MTEHNAKTIKKEVIDSVVLLHCFAQQNYYLA